MTVARSRFFSTIEPPPMPLPPAPPTPKAPESPASFPECSRMRKMRTTAKITWMTLKNVYMRGKVYGNLGLLDLVRLAGVGPVAVPVGRGAIGPVEDLKRFATQLGVE